MKQIWKSLKFKMSAMIIIGWIVPVLIICLFMTMSYKNGIVTKTETIMKTYLQNYTANISTKLDEAIELSKKVSYDKVFETPWRKYKKGEINAAKLYTSVRGALNTQFHNDRRFSMSCFYFTDNPEQVYSTSRDRNAYQVYTEKIKKAAMEVSKKDTTAVFVQVIDERLYIIRNLYTITGYEKFGTLILEMNRSVLFQDADKYKDFDIAFFVNSKDGILVDEKANLEPELYSVFNRLEEFYSPEATNEIRGVIDGHYQGILYQKYFQNYHLGAFLIEDTRNLYSELRQTYLLLGVISVIIIPIIIYLLVFMWKNISIPMEHMIEAAKALRKGKMGIQIDKGTMPNIEFEELIESFNKMSSEIKYLFDYAYNEEIAKRDAQIMALQSQINPHFLNNTLEMMNWQARMSGAIEVTKMIEALGTLLDYSMDRDSRRMISLAEELRCADAYFYISSMRFGQRLHVEKEVDESLLQVKIPQLILQPILENAIVHGVEKVKSGTIWLKIFCKERCIALQIINTGIAMTEEDIKKVNAILEGSYTPAEKEKGKHVSLGIRNVNQRLHLIYGEKYGLTIEPGEDDTTISTILIPYKKEGGEKNETDK